MPEPRERERHCWLRLQRHRWYWTGRGYQSRWGGWRSEKACERCDLRLWITQ